MALGIGGAVAITPCVAWADDSVSTTSDSPSSTSESPSTTQDRVERGGQRAAGRERTSPAPTASRPPSDGTAGPRSSTRAGVLPAAATAEVQSGSDYSPQPDIAWSLPQTGVVGSITASAKPALPALPVPASAGPTLAAVTPQPAVAVAAVAQPAAAVSGVSSLAGVVPSGNGNQAPTGPLNFVTAALSLISREINRLLFNSGPTAKPVLTSQTNTLAGSIGGSDPEGDPLSYAIAAAPTHGSVVVDSAGNFTYTADESLAATGGQDTFVVEVRDTGFHLNFWVPTTISVPVTVTVPALQTGIGDSGAGTGRRFSASLSVAGPAAAATLPSSSPSVTYSVGDNWGSGFIGNMNVTAGQSNLNGWTVTFNTPAQITNIWNGVISSHVGDAYTVTNAPWNGQVTAGQSTSFGFQASPTSTGSAVTGLQINGVAGGVAPTLPGVTVANATVAEPTTATAPAVFVVTLSKASTTPISIGYTTTNGTATAGSDYTATSGTLSFAAGVTTQQISVPVLRDTITEPTETFAVTLSNPSGATLTTATATGTITNTAVTVTPPPTTSSGSVTYTVADNWGSGFNGTMNVTAGQALNGWTVSFNTPAEIVNVWNGVISSRVGTAYVVTNAPWNGQISAGQSTSFGFQANTGAAGSAITGLQLNGVAVATPTPTAPGVSVAGVTVAEPASGTAQAAFTVALSKASSTPVTVGYATTNGTATAGSDFTATTGTLTFAPGVTSQQINVPILRDTLVEPSETFAVTLSNPSGATITTATATGTITDSNAAGAAPKVSIADLAVTEGNGEHAHFMFTATLDKASATPVSVGYATSNGTATAGVDYTASSGTITFAPGVTTQTVHVGILGDTAIEPNEKFSVNLSAPSGLTIARATAIGTILNDDVVAAPTPGLSISDASATEPGSGGMAPGFLRTAGNQIIDSQGKTVQISGVNWFGMESTTGAPHGLWTRGYKEMIDQMVGLGFNTIRLPYSSELLHTSAAPNGIDFSKNPDLQGLSGLQVMDAIVAYAGQQGMRVILDHHRSGAGAGTSENGLWYDGTYTEDAWVADWVALANRYKTNSTVIGFDLHNEPHNGTWGGGGANDWARAAERAGNAALAVNPDLLMFVEGVGTYQGQNYWWGGNLMGVKDRPIVFNVANRLVYSPHDYPNSVFPQTWFQTTDFGADLPAVFRKAWGYIYEENIAPIYIGEFGTKLVDPKDAVWLEALTSYISGDLDNNGTNDIPAGNQDISWTYWSWNPNSGDTGGILADDWRTVNQSKMAYLTPVQFTAAGGSSLAAFTVSLSKASTSAVTVGYTTSNGTATAGSDYIASSGTLTFAPGETSRTIAIIVNGDATAESRETFTVTLSNPSGATLVDGSGAGSITDRVTTPTSPVTPVALPRVSIADLAVTEGNGAHAHFMFTATLDKASATAVTVGYTTANGTATAGVDYTGAAGTISFAPGVTTQQVHVDILGDATVEPDETFSVTLSNPSGVSIARATAIGSILNDDLAGPTPTPPATGTNYVDLMTYGMFHGNDHHGMDALVGGRTAITTEAVVAYNDLRRFAGLAPTTIEDVGRWAFANGLTNNAQAGGNDLKGVGLFYAMQGAKVGWIADAKYNPQIVADIERTARLGSAQEVMAMVATYGHAGYAEYLISNGYQTAFINTLKMEPHWAGWMHDRAHGTLPIEGGAAAHDVNHLTVLSHDQMRPFMNDTWDYPQWPALNVSAKRVIEYYQSMVTLGNPLGDNAISASRTITGRVLV